MTCLGPSDDNHVLAGIANGCIVRVSVEDLAFERVRPRELCNQALAAISERAESKKIEVALSVPERLPAVTADPHKIVRVLITLLTNAVGYTKSGGHVSLQGEQVGNQVHLSVTDEGPGIPAEVQHRIFDKFIHLKPGDPGVGSGLGLTICKELVKVHHGAIWLNSITDQGSTFTFTLPVAG